MISQSDLLSAGGSLECGVCLLEFLPSDAYTLSSCGHALHRSCLRENIVARLRAGDTAMACYESGCGLPLLDSDLSTLLDGEEGAEAMRRLARRRLERSEPSVRFCPSAGCESEVRGGSEATPELTCRVCGVGFCFLHNTAHAPGRAACAAYTARERESPEYAASLAQVALTSRRCPKPACGTFVERAGGCNSIVCSRCGTTFCWLCGCEITAGELPIHYQVRACCCARAARTHARPHPPPTHTQHATRTLTRARPSRAGAQWWNLKSDCRFRQFVDTGGKPISAGFRLFLNFGTLLYAIFFGLPGMVVAAALCLLMPCCSISVLRSAAEGPFITFMTLSSIISSILLLVLACLLASPVVIPLLLLAGIIRLVIWAGGWSAPAEAEAVASPERAGEGAGAGAGAGAAGPAAALSTPPLTPTRMQGSGGLYAPLSTPSPPQHPVGTSSPDATDVRLTVV